MAGLRDRCLTVIVPGSCRTVEERSRPAPKRAPASTIAAATKFPRAAPQLLLARGSRACADRHPRPRYSSATSCMMAKLNLRYFLQPISSNQVDRTLLFLRCADPQDEHALKFPTGVLYAPQVQRLLCPCERVLVTGEQHATVFRVYVGRLPPKRSSSSDAQPEQGRQHNVSCIWFSFQKAPRRQSRSRNSF